MSADTQIPQRDDRPATGVIDTYAAKITATYGAVLASHEQQVDNHLTLARLLGEAKEAIPYGSWLTFVEEQLPFSARKAEMYLTVGQAFDGIDSQMFANLRHRLPSSIVALYQLALLGRGNLIEALAAKNPDLVFADMTIRDVEELSARFRTPETPEVLPEEPKTPPVPAKPIKRKPRAVLTLEDKVMQLERDVAYERTQRRGLELNRWYGRGEVACTLCGREATFQASEVQRDLTFWIEQHLAEAHPGEEEFIRVATYVRATIDRYSPMPQVVSEQTRAGWEEMAAQPNSIFAAFSAALHGGRFAQALPASTVSDSERPDNGEKPATEPDETSDDNTALAAFCRRAYGE